MIKKDARLRIERVPLSCLQITELGEPWTCFPSKFQTYLELLTNNPEQDVDPLIVAPSVTHDRMFAVLNGKHRMCASIMAGRKDVLAVVIEENA